MQSQLQRGNMNANESDPSSLEKRLPNSPNRSCSANHCTSASLIVLGEKPFCLQHFLIRCYEWLDQLDPAAREKFNDEAETARVKALVEECSNRALLVSLRCETLDNLDRSRLLDILLRCSDLLYALRIPSDISAWLPIYPSSTPKPRERARILASASPLLTNKSYGV